MLRAITADWGVPLMFVEGNADLTTGKLVGHHAPDRVLREGYLAENFVDGPLVEAMRLGGFLYIEELNRSPQDTLNTLLSAIGDRRLTIPRIGTITAKPTFRLIASMNPFDNVGTMRISMSIYDRLCRLAVGYQDESLEREIVEQRAGGGGDRLQRDDRLVARCRGVGAGHTGASRRPSRQQCAGCHRHRAGGPRARSHPAGHRGPPRNRPASGRRRTGHWSSTPSPWPSPDGSSSTPRR